MSNPFNYIAINLTNRCNTFCKYCFQNSVAKDKDYLDYQFVTKMLDYTRDKADGKRILHLTGGEPTLNPDFFGILEYAIKHQYVVRIQSNGLSWLDYPEEKMRLLKEPKVSIKISLDGWNKETHEYLRAPNSFEPVVSSIRRIKEYCSVVGIKTCVHTKNISCLENMLFLADDLKLQGFSYNMIREEGAALSYLDKCDLNIEEIEVAKRLIPYFNQKKYQYLMNGNNLLLFYYTSGDIKYQKHFYIDYDGSVFPHQSCLQNERMGNVIIDGFSALDVEKAICNGHSHIVDIATVDYVKKHFVPIKKR